MTGLVALAVLIVGGRAVQDAVPPPPPTVRVADDICAIMLDVRAQVSDGQGKPVAGAELRAQDQSLESDDWHLVGTSDATGRVQRQFCYQSASVYIKRPPSGAVTLRFRITRGSGSTLEFQEQVQASRLVRDGLLVKRQGGGVVPDKAALKGKAYRVSLRASLRE